MNKVSLFYVAIILCILGLILIGLGIGIWLSMVWVCVLIGLGLGMFVSSLIILKITRRLIAYEKK